MANKVAVFVRIEPPIKWPLWFDNSFLDSEDIPGLSNEMKSEGYSLSAFFVESTSWCSAADCYYWKDESALPRFRDLAENYCARLAHELGDAFDVHAITASVSTSGHAEILAKSTQGIDTGNWYPHTCK